MGFFSGVRECNQRNGGRHSWGEPQKAGGDFKQTCDDCGVSSWGSSEAEGMARSREFDRANRSGRLW